jgi:hypothetical protein
MSHMAQHVEPHPTKLDTYIAKWQGKTLNKEFQNRGQAEVYLLQIERGLIKPEFA